MSTVKVATLAAVLAGALSLAGCSKKAAQATPPPAPPAPPAPTATLAASPDAIQQGQSATLTWQRVDDLHAGGKGPRGNRGRVGARDGE